MGFTNQCQEKRTSHTIGLTRISCYAKFLNGQRSSAVEQRTHKPLVDGSNPSAATSKTTSHPIDQRTTQNSLAYPHAIDEQGISLKQAIDGFLLTCNPLLKIKVPKAEKKIIKALSYEDVSKLISAFNSTFEGKRNKAIILVLVDSGLRLGELLSLTMDNLNMEQQLLKVSGKTGERIVRFGRATAKALLKYLMARQRINGSSPYLWITGKDTPLKPSAIETISRALSRKTGIRIHPHLLRHTFATLWLKNGGDSLMLQRLLGHTTLMMTNRYCQAVGCYDAIESHKKYSPVDRLRG